MRWFPLSQSLSVLVLATSLFVTYQLWKDARHSAEQILQTDFDFLVRESNRRIEQRVQTYKQVLRGAVGLFAASDRVDRQGFRRYVASLRLGESYPGIEGIGYSMVIPREQKEEHVAAVRSEGFPDYTIRPEGEREIYSSIVYLEPFSGRNLRAFGYDMYSEPVRRAAMEKARDAGRSMLSGKVTLVQEGGSRGQAGFLMYLPVYRGGTPPETVEQRRAALAGWVYAPFRINDFMAGLMGESGSRLSVSIYDGTEISDQSLMYQDNQNIDPDLSQSQFVRFDRLEFNGHYWTIVTHARPNFEASEDVDKAALVLRGGVGASILLTLLAWLLVDERARAMGAAHRAMRMALYDMLTDLPNRKLFTDRLLHSLARAKRDKNQLAVMFIDLDKFKPVNDKFGHTVGDLLLKQVARRLQECVRKSDTVARLGGDEFVVLIPTVVERHGDLVVAEKILKALATPFHIDGHNLQISSSIGIAVYPEDGDDEKSLLRNADTAMYHAKKSGRNSVRFFNAEMLEDES
jgi:diguanylate cyclase (GGDEF)-like protein